MSPKLFPSLLILLSAAAAVVYACDGDARKAIYWAAAATLNAAVTF
jgi:hypothetical protein